MPQWPMRFKRPRFLSSLARWLADASPLATACMPADVQRRAFDAAEQAQRSALAEAEAFHARATAPGRFVPLPPAETLFGKTRGRFDEAAARASDRMLPERAIGVIVPMPPAEFDAFVRLFNDVFGRDGRPRRFEIREIGRG